jgi:hypothetical protein
VADNSYSGGSCGPCGGSGSPCNISCWCSAECNRKQGQWQQQQQCHRRGFSPSMGADQTCRLLFLHFIRRQTTAHMDTGKSRQSDIVLLTF